MRPKPILPLQISEAGSNGNKRGTLHSPDLQNRSLTISFNLTSYLGPPFLEWVLTPLQETEYILDPIHWG